MFFSGQLWHCGDKKTCDEQQHKSENDQLDRFVYSDKTENHSFSNEDFDLLKAYSLELPLDVSEILLPLTYDIHAC